MTHNDIEGNIDKHGPELQLPLLSDPTRLGSLTRQLLLQNFTPAAVLVDSKYRILYYFGSTERYLRQPTGTPTDDLMARVHQGLRNELGAVLAKAARDQKPVSLGDVRMKRESGYQPVRLSAKPLAASVEAAGLMLIVFEDHPVDIPKTAKAEALRVQQLEHELKASREEHRTILREQDDSHVELTLLNQELHSTNDVLDTSKAVLQALNEELTVLNNQFQDKVLALETANDDLDNLLNSTEIATIFLDTQFQIKRFTSSATRLLNLTTTDLDRPLSDIAGKLQDRTLLEDARGVLDTLAPSENEVRAGEHWYLRCVTPYRRRDRRIDGVVITFTDITARKQAEHSLFEEKERAQVTLNSIGDAVITTDADGVVQYLNTAAELLTGWPLSEAQGRDLEEVYHVMDERQHELVVDPLSLGMEKNPIIEPPHILISRNNSEYAIQETAAPIRGREGEVLGVVRCFQNVTEQRRITNMIAHQASHDALTGLANRREFEYRLERILQTARTQGTANVLCYLDLDQFKVINDTCGHLSGDELLRQVAGLLQAHIRKRDTLARLGGDEFGILMEHCTLIEGRRVVTELQRVIEDFRFLWEDGSFAIGVSIGMVTIDSDSGNMTDLLKNADAACYMAKERGRNRIHIYHRDDHELAKRHGEMQWVARIQSAMEEGRFQLYYQPLSPLGPEQGHGASYELLLRMQNKQGAMVLPGVFLPAAERYGLSTRLDRWVVNEAFAWLQAHPQQLQHLALCSINLSALSLGDEAFLQFVSDKLRANQLPPDRLCFEITETTAITHLASAIQFIKTLKALGCRFALDDFGSGLSSFGYLKNLPVDYLKIDGAFVKDIIDDPVDLAMVRSINEIGHILELQTIAEYAENAMILEKLRNLGVDYAQGYAISPPRPLLEMEEPWAAA